MLAFINGLSPMHILLLLVVALLLFGNRLPDVARSIGRAFNEFKRGLRDVNDEIGRDDAKPAEKPKLSPPTEHPHAATPVARTPERVEAPKHDAS